ncbi:hypothetical protein AAVH_40352 [Aphelenchoides avenae]|nr:hypothetical protein AAVH_40352 [Aphelenchus avenae]
MTDDGTTFSVSKTAIKASYTLEELLACFNDSDSVDTSVPAHFNTQLLCLGLEWCEQEKGDEFLGLRVAPSGPLALYAQATPGNVISYNGYTSLYPSVNLNTRYPVSHARVTVLDTPKVNWTSVSDNPYEGLLKVKVVPPRKTMIPVLPNKFDDERLLFALCRSCAMDLKSDIPFDYECPHEDDERALIVTLPHIEINLALENGYKLTALYRIKLEASKWPDTVKDDEELKKEYIIEYLQMQGINIDPEKVGHNEGMSYVAKLFLNSLWGRFGIQNQLSKFFFTTSPHEVSDILNQKDLY